MARSLLGVVAGLAGWFALAAAAGVILRVAWPEYATVADAMTFTLPMMFARLAIGAVATLAGGWVTAAVARRSMVARLAAGLLLVVVFVPEHIRLWDTFPVWYHLLFLTSLVPLTWLGGVIARRPAPIVSRVARAG
jgi:hypothetical protein